MNPYQNLIKKPEFINPNTGTKQNFPESLPLGIWTNNEQTFGLRLPNNVSNVDKIVATSRALQNLFDTTRDENFINQNRPKIRFWNNVGFIFTTGSIYTGQDIKILNEILKYFDTNEPSFLPNLVKITNYTDPLIKKFENIFDIGEGNYHYGLIPFVLKDDNNPSESAYSKAGPVDFFVNPEDIVSYMMEVNYKYGAIKTLLGPTISNYLNLNTTELDYSTTQHNKTGTHGIARTMNPTTDNPYLHGANTRRIRRKGYIDPDTNDAYELIDPEENIQPEVDRHLQVEQLYQRPEDYKQTSTFSSDRQRYYAPRRDGLYSDTGINKGIRPKRQQGKNSLLHQIYATEKGFENHVGTSIISNEKGVHLKVNDYYETLQNQQQKPDYILYSEEEENEDYIDKFINKTKRSQNPQQFDIDLLKYVNQGDKILKPKLKAEEVGVFGPKPSHL